MIRAPHTVLSCTAFALIVALTPAGLAFAQEGSAGEQDMPLAETEEKEVCNLEPYIGYLRQIQAGEYQPTATKEQNDEITGKQDNESSEEQNKEQESENVSEDDITATSTEPSPADAESSGVAKPDELTVRKELMVRIIDCAIADAVDLRASIEALTLVGAEEGSLQERFINRVNEAIRHYELQKIEAREGELDVDGVRRLARDLGGWRNGTYASLERSVQNFTMWTKNQDLIDTAQTRLSQVRQTIKDFQLGGNDLIEESFDRARFFVDRARDANRKAQTGLIHEKPSQEVLGDLKDAVSDLYRTYNEFFTLSGTVKGYLLTR